MARVLIETQAWGIVQDTNGNVQVGQVVSIAKAGGGAATTYTAQVGGASTTASLTTGARGEIPNWIEDGEYDLSVASATRRVEAVSATGEASTIYIEAGLAAPGAAVQSAFNTLAAGLTDGQVVLRAGIHTWESVPALPPNLNITLTVRGAFGHKIVLQSGANRAFDFGKTAEYDTFKNIVLRDLVIDRNNISANRHVVCGTMPAAAWDFRINFDTIKIANITTLNVPTDSTSTLLNPNIWIYPGADTTDTQCSVKNITIEDCDFGGGNFGITVGGVWRTSGTLANVFVDNIKLRRIKHTIAATPTSNYTSAHILCIGRAFGGRVLLENIEGINSGDVGIEIDAATKATIRSCEIKEAYNAAFYHTNFQQPKNQYAQQIQWIDCHGHRETAALGRGWKTEQAAATATGTGNVTNLSPSITSVATTNGGFQVGNTLTGTGIPAGTVITAISGSTITINQNASATNTGVTISGSPYPGPQRVVDSTWHRNTADWTQNGDAIYISDCPRYELRGVKLNVQGFTGTGSVSAQAVYLNAVSSLVRCRFVARNVQLRMNGTSSSGTAFYLGMAMDRGNWTFDIDEWFTDIDVTSAAAAHTLGFQLGRTSAFLNGTMSRVRFAMGSATGDTGSNPIAIGGTGTLSISRKFYIKDCSLKDMFNNTSALVTFTAPTIAGGGVVVTGTERKSTADEPIATITAGASPYSYQNLDGFREDVVVAGGTVSALDYSRDNATFYTLGATAGKFPVEPGDYLRVTYTVAPTMTKIPWRV